MSILQLAWKNIRHQAGRYTAFFTSSTFAVWMFFMYASLYFHPAILVLDSLTLRENILLPLALEGVPAAQTEERVQAVAARMGIVKVLDHYPYQVSGGEKQRAAACRALVHQPALILADEPTGNLDSKAARALMESLSDLNQQDGATILMVTHDPVSASYCRRIVFINDGRPFTELRRGADRQPFFQQILDVLATLGGDPYQLAYGRR